MYKLFQSSASNLQNVYNVKLPGYYKLLYKIYSHIYVTHTSALSNLLKVGPAEAEATASSSRLEPRPQLPARRSWWGKRAMLDWARWASCWGRGKATLPWRKGPAASPHWPSLAACCCCCCWLMASRAKDPWRSERAMIWLVFGVADVVCIILWAGGLVYTAGLRILKQIFYEYIKEYERC